MRLSGSEREMQGEKAEAEGAPSPPGERVCGTPDLSARRAPVANQAQIVAFYRLNQRLVIQLAFQPLT